MRSQLSRTEAFDVAAVLLAAWQVSTDEQRAHAATLLVSVLRDHRVPVPQSSPDADFGTLASLAIASGSWPGGMVSWLLLRSALEALAWVPGMHRADSATLAALHRSQRPRFLRN